MTSAWPFSSSPKARSPLRRDQGEANIYRAHAPVEWALRAHQAWLPNGVIMLNDDDGDRMVAIDPTSGALVWQYGVTGQPGTAPGLLNTPDGFDVLGPRGSTPTHPATG